MKDRQALKFKFEVNLGTIFTAFAVAGGLGAIALFFGEKIIENLGEFSYNGLRPDQIQAVYEEFQKKFDIFSKVGGYRKGGKQYFERGIALSKNGGNAYYFHHVNEEDGEVEFEMYPMVFESWTTNPGIFGRGKELTGDMLYPLR